MKDQNENNHINTLLDLGFTFEQAIQLVILHEIYEAYGQQHEPKQVNQLNFARWLFEHGHINEGEYNNP